MSPPASSAASSPASRAPARLAWLGATALLLALLALAVGRVALTYRTFSQTVDEPVHIAVGMEWLDRGSYDYEPAHPPFGRVAAAIGPYLDGRRSAGLESEWDEGDRILTTGPSYTRTLALARAGLLPFLILFVVVVWHWSRALFGTGAAAVAAVVATMLPPVLAHGGLATTDMAGASTMLAAAYAWVRWLDRQTLKRCVVLGVAVALALLSKMSAVLFLPVVFGSVLLVWWVARRRPRAPQAAARVPVRRVARDVAIAALAGALVLWAGYRFAVTRVMSPELRPHAAVDERLGTSGWKHDLAYTLLEAKLPAGPFFRGILDVAFHNAGGHRSYLLGEVRRYGWWYFFPVAFLVKTPIPVLVLLAVGAAAIIRARRREDAWRLAAPLVAALAIMASVIPSSINIGIRHILLMYGFVAIVAGAGGAALLGAARRRRLTLATLAVLLAWLSIDSIATHPDYLAYFNEPARPRADRILMDSDLDWQQDVARLRDTLHARRIGHVSIAMRPTVPARLPAFGFPPYRRLTPFAPDTGWIAADLFALRLGTMEGPAGAFAWLDELRPEARIGKSIRLYHVSAAEAAAASLRTAAARRAQGAADTGAPADTAGR